jgi:hypothetical protein
MPASEPNAIVDVKNRPPIRMICYIDSHGNPHEFNVGSRYEFKGTDVVTEIREVGEYGEYTMIPWVEVWSGINLIARFNQHKLEHIFYLQGVTNAK